MGRRERAIGAIVFGLVSIAANGAETVSFESAGERVNALLGQPQAASAQNSGAARGTPAVVLIHSAGGYKDGTTAPLARALNSAGFATLELRFFDRPAARRVSYEQMTQAVFDSLGFLAAQPEVDPMRIGVAGFSMGAYLAIWTASESLTESWGRGLHFAAHAPVYPVCWQQANWAKAQAAPKFPPLSFPSRFLTSFTGAPVKLFAAGRDDYDDRDPNACREFVNAIDEKYRGAFEVSSYPEATHGWNQSSQSFFSEAACKGRGCMNRNVFDRSVSEANTRDVVEFFSDKLRSR